MDESVATTVAVNPNTFNAALYVILAFFGAFIVAAGVAWKRARDIPEV